MVEWVMGLFHWLAERIHDAAMWPVNLVRDFPGRLGRLLWLLGQGGRGVVSFLPGWWRATQAHDGRRWWRGQVGSLLAGLHQLAAALFDLVGGPEIVQFWLRLPAVTTSLTGPEIAIIATVLGPTALRFGDVRVAEGGWLHLVFKLNGNLAFATWHTIHLPRTGRHTRANRPILVHELTHVYQYEKVGTRYLGEAIYMLIKTRRDCYNYGGVDGLQRACADGRCYADYNREQQAKITQDYYDLHTAGSDVTAYEPFMAQVRAGEL